METNNNKKGISFFNKIMIKIKTIKNWEIFVALVIALVSLLIYFSVGMFNENSKNSQTVTSSDKSQIESTLSEIEGVGECKVVITYKSKDKSYQESNFLKDDTEVYGVVVVAEGGDNVYTRIKIVDALSVLLNIGNSQIKIYKSK